MIQQATQAAPAAGAGGQAATENAGSDASFDSFDSDLAGSLSGLLDRDRDDNLITETEDAGDDVADEPRGEDPSDEDPGDRQSEDATGKRSEEAGKDAQATEDPEHVVKIDGQEKRVKLSDLLASYQKGEASGKRFEEAANLRREVEQNRQQVQAERSALAAALQHYTQQLQSLQEQSQPNWEELLQRDPVEFQRQQYYFQQRQQQLQQAQAAQAYLAQQQQAQELESTKQRLTTEAQKMLQAIPEWSDPAKAEAGRKELREALMKTGFSQQEVDGIADHRMVLVAHKAMLYDRLIAEQKAAQTAAVNKLAKLPPARVERPGTANSTQVDGRSRAMQRLARSGSVEDAADVIATLL